MPEKRGLARGKRLYNIGNQGIKKLLSKRQEFFLQNLKNYLDFLEAVVVLQAADFVDLVLEVLQEDFLEEQEVLLQEFLLLQLESCSMAIAQKYSS